MFEVKLTFLVELICLFSQATGNDITIANVPKFTGYGPWGEWEYCPKGEFAVAFTVKYEPDVGPGDDTGLNAICLYCAPLGFKYNNTSKRICSTIGTFGHFVAQPYECPFIITGFNLRSEADQGAGDDTAATGIKILCSNGEVIESEGAHFGAYGFEQKCLKGQAICGIRTQVEPNQDSADDTALNNVEMKCCDIPPMSTSCVPTDKWVKVLSCDNILSKAALHCTFTQRVGTSMTATKKLKETQVRSMETLTSAGVSVGVSVAGFGLKAGLSAAVGTTLTTGYDWSKEKSNTFTKDVTSTVEFKITGGIKTTIYQVVASCDIYTIRSSKFFRSDTKIRRQVVKPYVVKSGFFCSKLSEDTDLIVEG